MIRFQSNDSSYWPAVQDRLLSLFEDWRERSGTSMALTADIPQNLSFAIGHHVGLSIPQKLQLIALGAEADRQVFLSRHLQRVMAKDNG